MRTILIILIIPTLLFIGCIDFNSKEISKQSYIETYTKVDNSCKEKLIKIIEPFGYEDETCKISEIYLLDVRLDSNIYERSQLLYKYFLGIEFEPDSCGTSILVIDTELGTISPCQTITGDKLIINNLWFLFTDIFQYGELDCIEIDESDFPHIIGQKTMFRQVIWTNGLYGSWKPDTIRGDRFENSIYNHDWLFLKEDIISITDLSQDTLLKDNFIFQGNDIEFKKTGERFEVITMGNDLILLRGKDQNRIIYLTKQE